ncbi:MAG TPA: energy-coupling factor transporter transmembrane component T [Methanocella sp.]|uniref:energy-coupling factor transporter transmembrane component T family protein n=1 Tax=Methanocella sp. TaxID=2052833 RepID=UPI002CD27B2E|nr:energy-coupling factor transporter transmembrane component T [Methanocella sp.]HTY91277.1 energy-coupling factor transporter transmembrane component T [Methanocella sp.]
MKASVKILALAMMSVLIIGLPIPWLYIPVVAVALFILILKASLVRLLRMLLPALPFIVAISALQALLQGGGDILARWWILNITVDGINLAALSALRMLPLYLAGSAVTITTGEAELTKTIERAFCPLDRLAGSSVGRDIATMTMLALAFIPMVSEEYASIRLAQEARGVRHGTARGMAAVIVPLVSSLSRRADDVALAMEARCYGLDK